MREKCLAQEHNTMPTPAQTWTAQKEHQRKKLPWACSVALPVTDENKVLNPTFYNVSIQDTSPRYCSQFFIDCLWQKPRNDMSEPARALFAQKLIKPHIDYHYF